MMNVQWWMVGIRIGPKWNGWECGMVSVGLDLMTSEHLPFKIQHFTFDRFLNPFSLSRGYPATDRLVHNSTPTKQLGPVESRPGHHHSREWV